MSQDFIVSARKYRPQTFDDVVGQLHITGTLQNAVRTGKVAHAFLFCGPRGVGKTTCARILAKVLNCFNLSDTIEPCNTCASCEGFNTSHSFNIHELDAASNNGVDDMRQLIEQVRMAPQIGKYSIYIIDEVHMLTTQAFNAFLKTLEEPPKHAIFIMATTEKHKVLPTILSRCQVFDFRRITVDDIAGHLGRIAVKENIEAEPDGLHVIAQKADGALRDALSIFDRMVTFSGNKFGYREVIDNLNILDYDYYFKILDCAVKQQHSDILLLLHEILNHGFDGGVFLSGLSEHIRNLMMVQDMKTAKLVEVGENARQMYLDQSGVLDARQLLAMLELVHSAENQYKSAQNKRLLLEITLLRLLRVSAGGGGTPEADPKPVSNARQSGSQSVAGTASAANVAAPVSEPLPPARSSVAAVKAPASTSNSTLTPGTGNGRRTISINAVVKKSETESQQREKRKCSFTSEELFAAWNACREKFVAEGLQASVMARLPECEGEEQIILTLEHKGLEPTFDAMKQDILTHLCEALKNDYLTLVPRFQKRNGTRSPYTPQEKFDALLPDYPFLQEWKQKFNLQF